MGKIEAIVTERMKHAANNFFKGANIETYKSVCGKDLINHPHHYIFGKYEVADVLDDWFPTNPHLWIAVQYIARAEHKDATITDLEKAVWYLRRHIELAKEKDRKVQQILTNATYNYVKDEECRTKKKSRKTTSSNGRKR